MSWNRTVSPVRNSKSDGEKAHPSAPAQSDMFTETVRALGGAVGAASWAAAAHPNASASSAKARMASAVKRALADATTGADGSIACARYEDGAAAAGY